MAREPGIPDWIDDKDFSCKRWERRETTATLGYFRPAPAGRSERTQISSELAAWNSGISLFSDTYVLAQDRLRISLNQLEVDRICSSAVKLTGGLEAASSPIPQPTKVAVTDIAIRLRHCFTMQHPS